jgi:hypothetical protein
MIALRGRGLRRFVLLLTLLLAWPGFAANTTIAQDATPVTAAASIPAFVLAPVGEDSPFITESLEPGESTKVTVQLGNAGSQAVEARTFSADAYTLVNGGFGVKTADDERTGATTWVDYPSETLELKPGEVVERTINIAVPEGTPPGEYISGLVLETAEPIGVPGSSMLRQNIQKSIAVLVTVPGKAAPALDVGMATIDQRTQAPSVQIEIANSGNVLLKPAGTVTVSEESGSQVVEAPVQMGSVYAGTQTTLQIALPTTLAPGTYSVHIELNDEAKGVAVDEDRSASAVDPDEAENITPVVVEELSLDPARDPSTDQLQYVNVQVAITNAGNPVEGVRITLHVTRDGAPLEDLPLAAGLAMPVGPTQVTQRYIPPDGWTAGTYGFAVTVDAVTAAGQVTSLAELQSPDTVTAP